MPRFTDQEGNVWEANSADDPNPVLVQPAQRSGTFIPSPTAPYEAPKAAADAANAQANAVGQQIDNQFARPLAETELRAREMDLREREIKLAEAQQGRVEKEEMEGSKTLRQRLSTGNVLDAIRQARALARKGGTGYSSLLSALPKSDARALEAAIAPLKGNLAFERLQQMREESVTGGALGNVSERELDLLASVVASLDTGVDQDQFLANLDRIERHFVNSQVALSGIDPASEEGQAVYREYGIKPTTAMGSGGNADGGGGAYKIGVDEQYATEQDKRFAALVQSAFDKGASAEELNALNQQYGYPAFNPDELAQAIQFRDGGGQGVEVRAPESGYNDPSILERGIQNLGASPLGTYFGQAGNALSLGTLDELGGIARGDSISDAFSGRGVNTNQINLQKSLQAEANPKSAILGNVSGGIIGALGGGAALGAGKAVGALTPRALAGDAAFGSAFGAGEDNDNRLGGAALGAVAGAGGGAIGRGAMGAVGRAVGGVQGPARDLYQQGIRLTPGQIGEGINQSTPGGSTFGRFLKGREDRLSGYSGIGDAIGGAQTRGVQDFNRAAFREGVREVPPGLGEEAVDYANDVVVPGAYGRALDSQQFTPDQQFTQGLSARMGEAQGLPALGEQTQYQLQRSIAPFIDETDTISGRNMQKMTQELQRRGARLDRSADADGPDAASILAAARDDIGGMVERQAPGVMDDFREANTIFRNTKILEDAVGRGMNTDGLFTPAQLGMAAKQNAKKYGGRYASQDRPFYDLQRAAQNILPSKVPDSGTAGREAAGDGLLGTAKAFARNLRSPMYSDTAIDMINTIAFERPELLRSIGDVVVKNRRKAGLFGSPLSVYAVSD